MAILYNVSEATISRIVAAHRQLFFQECYTTLGTFMGLDPGSAGSKKCCCLTWRQRYEVYQKHARIRSAALLNRARNDQRPFNELLQFYAMERFLYRLSQSVHIDRFILKGALMFESLVFAGI